MLLAMAAVEKGKMGKNIAAREFGVPASTLKDSLSGRVKHRRKPGPVPSVPYVTEDKETELVGGFGYAKREVIVIVQKAV